MKKIITFFVMTFIVIGLISVVFCSHSSSNPNSKDDDTKEELVFQTGFEGTTQVIPYEDENDDIIGYERGLPKSSWDELKTNGGINLVFINYTGGDSTHRTARIIPEPGNSKNKVLRFQVLDSWGASERQTKARVQVEFHKITPGYKEFYQSMRVFLHEDFNALRSYPKRISWLTLSEFWNNEWWFADEKYGFRVTLGVGKPTGETSDLIFILNAEDAGMKEVWNGDNYDVKVPIGKWFTLDYYFKEGDNNTGRFYMTITPENGKKQVVFDIHNFTHFTKDPAPDGVTGYNPMKLYTSKEVVSFMKEQGKSLQIYWDDFKLWKNKRPE